MTQAKVAVIAGVRPQYIKLAAFTAELANRYDGDSSRLILVDTRQHYDLELHDAVIEDLTIQFDVQLSSKAGLTPAARIGATVSELSSTFRTKRRPSGVIVFGDADPALAGALYAQKEGIPLAHLEAGARRDPIEQEHYNSRVIDISASLKTCVTDRALRKLQDEAVDVGAVHCGDLAARWYLSHVESLLIGDESSIDVLVSIHRPMNITAPRIREICQALSSVQSVLWITHPRYSDTIIETLRSYPNITLTAGLTFSNCLRAVHNSQIVMSDSGGLLREAHLMDKPVIVRRDFGGWPELVDAGLAYRCDPDRTSIGEGLSWARERWTCNPAHQPSPLAPEGGVEMGFAAIHHWMGTL
jgi:UDP-N-acetylglucosamine 2-epimerase (non-hydrolysing)